MRANFGPFGRGGGQLYPFTNVTFGTPYTGQTYPSLAQMISSMSGTGISAWNTNTQYFNSNGTGTQLWTVPKTGLYRIVVTGARGGYSNGWGRWGGNGAYMQGDFSLIRGEILKIIVGQQGDGNYYDCGGGGGSFVVQNNNSPLIIAGGGGGGSASGFSGSGAAYANTGTSGYSTSWATGGSGGGGGQGLTVGGGGGLTGNGSGGAPGTAFVNGGYGGGAGYGASGGFGGGGGGGGTSGAGGGGGYSGGAASYWSYDGAGGGSYNAGTNQNNIANYQAGNGFVTITAL